jgi:hypothetical protein
MLSAYTATVVVTSASARRQALPTASHKHANQGDRRIFQRACAHVTLKRTDERNTLNCSRKCNSAALWWRLNYRNSGKLCSTVGNRTRYKASNAGKKHKSTEQGTKRTQWQRRHKLHHIASAGWRRRRHHTYIWGHGASSSNSWILRNSRLQATHARAHARTHTHTHTPETTYLHKQTRTHGKKTTHSGMYQYTATPCGRYY